MDMFLLSLCESMNIPSVRALMKMVTATDIMTWVAYRSIQGDDSDEFFKAPADLKPKTPEALFNRFKALTIKAGGTVN
jgi:hypothetical protein